ncbi:MAG TPA: hypothetical protein VLQ93_17415, partial [Myxococcaceae bacterium]|nr:hypothetical protein [Myxococcaceae bacterium]
MTIDLTCQKCEGTFELDAQDLIDGTEKLECPHCSARAPSNLQEDFVSALTEIRTQVAALGKRFSISMSLETEELEDELEEEEEEEEEEEREGGAFYTRTRDGSLVRVCSPSSASRTHTRWLTHSLTHS